MKIQKFKNQVKEVESIIDYEFNNKSLLIQAFTRKSYSAEHPGVLDNELLEHIGDSYLGTIVTKILLNAYTSVGPNGLDSKKNEKNFTDMKSVLVRSGILSEKIDDLGLSDYLIMGKGDTLKEVDTKDSVKEDLFEAIVGAVAIDSDFSMTVLEKLLDLMLNPNEFIKNDFKDTEENYIGELKEWFEYKKLGLPLYQESNDLIDNSNFICKINFEGQVFESRSTAKKAAKRDVSSQVLEYIKKHNMQITLIDLVRKPSLETSVNQLQELKQKGYLNNVTYTEGDLHLEGIYNWKVTCSIEGYDKVFEGVARFKKEAKKIAAYKMLEYLQTVPFNI